MEAHRSGEISDTAAVKVVLSSENIPMEWTFLRSPNQELTSLEKEIIRHPEAAFIRLRVRSTSHERSQQDADDCFTHGKPPSSWASCGTWITEPERNGQIGLLP